MPSNTAVSQAIPPCCFALALLCIASGPAWAQESSPEAGTEQEAEVAALQYNVGDYTIKGTGSLGNEAKRVRINVERHRLNQTPWFLSTEGRYEQEIRQPYDLRNWGGHLGLGYQFNAADSLLGKVRVDSYKVFNTGPNVDPAFQSVAGRTQVAAWGLDFKHDTRDYSMYPTSGRRFKFGAELALEALGGDYDFGRLESDVSFYKTPFKDSTEHAEWLRDVTFVEHFRAGWVENIGDSDNVPFFERYFVGGANTVRGHRSRWLTPRGLEQQFVGGEWQFVNNIEARKPIFVDRFQRKLSAAVFFDVGRAYRKLSDFGDLGAGVGSGLRYVVRLGPLSGVARLDYGVSFDNEGDDSTGKWHLTFGMPF